LDRNRVAVSSGILTKPPLTRMLSEEEIAELRKDMEESSRVMREYLKKNPI